MSVCICYRCVCYVFVCVCFFFVCDLCFVCVYYAHMYVICVYVVCVCGICYMCVCVCFVYYECVWCMLCVWYIMYVCLWYIMYVYFSVCDVCYMCMEYVMCVTVCFVCYVHMCTEANGWYEAPFLLACLVSFEIGSLTEPWAHWLAGLASQWAVGMLFFSASQWCWGYWHPLPRLLLQIHTQVLMLALQALHSVSHLPSPHTCSDHVSAE